MMDQAKYYRKNVSNTLNLLGVMIRQVVKNLIFRQQWLFLVSHNIHLTHIDEKHPKKQIKPYGSSKLIKGKILQDYSKAYGLNSVVLCSFNVCGSYPEVEIDECHEPETHLIPLI